MLVGLWAGPVSGASMNPARSAGPALASGEYGSLGIYLLGPAAGTDSAGYAEWDSGITAVVGDIGHGRSLRIRTAGLARSERVAVHRYGDGAMSWTFRLPGRLFKAVRTITVTAENGKTRLAVRDDFTGPLWTLIRKHTPRAAGSADRYVDGVRARAEKLS